VVRWLVARAGWGRGANTNASGAAGTSGIAEERASTPPRPAGVTSQVADAPEAGDAPGGRDAVDARDVSMRETSASEPPPTDAAGSYQRIGFGSCNELAKSHSLLGQDRRSPPAGLPLPRQTRTCDYGDTYAQLGAVAGFQKLFAHRATLRDLGRSRLRPQRRRRGTTRGMVSSKKKFIDF
jgi:hypothetical protein